MHDAPPELNRRALVQLGLLVRDRTQALERATAHVGAPIELAGLTNEALRWCG